MDQKPQHNWYPPPDHPRQDTDRIIFDNLYQLRDQQQAGGATPPQQSKGMSGTVVFPAPGFTVGGTTYRSLTFANGLLVSAS